MKALRGNLHSQSISSLDVIWKLFFPYKVSWYVNNTPSNNTFHQQAQIEVMVQRTIMELSIILWIISIFNKYKPLYSVFSYPFHLYYTNKIMNRVYEIRENLNDGNSEINTIYHLVLPSISVTAIQTIIYGKYKMHKIYRGTIFNSRQMKISITLKIK